MSKKTIPIFLAFLVMGFGDAVGPFVGLAKNEFHLSNTLAFIIPFLGFLMFGLLSVPMGIYQDRKGKKFILLLGLTIALIGLIIPIFGLNSFPKFLFTVLLLGIGATILQVAGNPIMRDVSEDGKYSRNLSLGQFVKAIGSLSGPVIPVVAARYFNMDWRIMFPIYSIFIFITIMSVASLKIEEKKDNNQKPANFKSCLSLLNNRYVLMMVLGIFLYVGAEVSISSGIPVHLKSRFGIDIQKLGLLGTGLFFTALVIGRFLGGVILNWIKAEKFFIITSIVSIISLLGLFTGIKSIVIISVIFIGFGFANIFPLIFSITIERLPEKTNELSGLMITAIVGGAILPPIMGFVADIFSTTIGFLVPTLAILYVLWLAISNKKKEVFA